MKEDKCKETSAVKSVLSGCVIYDKDAYSADSYATNPVGCGPYKVTEFVTGASVTIERDPNTGRQMKAFLHPLRNRMLKNVFLRSFLRMHSLHWHLRQVM